MAKARCLALCALLLPQALCTQDDSPPDALRKGTQVDVFYLWEKTHDTTPLLPVQTVLAGQICPRIGQSDGWQRATVLADWSRAGGSELGVLVMYQHRLWYDLKGNPFYEFKEYVRPEQVRPVAPHPRPVNITFAVVRWGGETEAEHLKETDGGWGDIGSSVSATYIRRFFGELVWPALGPTYQVISIMVRSSEDLLKIQATTLVPMMAGNVKVGMYFLWPSNYQDHQSEPAYVWHYHTLSLMADMEACGVTSRLPHHSHLYRLLLSKDWMAHMSLAPQFHVPATTKVNPSDIAYSPYLAATQALRSLSILQASRGGPLLPSPTPSGVVKLGYSWEAVGVMKWRGVMDLADKLQWLSQQSSLRSEAMMVQEMVSFECEMRLFFVHPDPEGGNQPTKILYTRFLEESEEGRVTNFQRTGNKSEATGSMFAGDEAAADEAERQAVALANRWLLWLLTESSEPIPALRIDVLVHRTGPGSVVVYSGELTEIGGCFLGWQQGPMTVWHAVLQSCLPNATLPSVESGIYDSLLGTEPGSSSGGKVSEEEEEEEEDFH